ncbi:hypothetical protein C2G38_2237288 [Gigaspora rosea]|uniref:BTB domain-containing protein n=1 Tax=Gigaspora rosea TaxID=44941 RepID=A0A397TNS1_9GLOM|nr:hypothetical protein C2G38_2237288 [Gigaspora rosea]
MVEIISEDLDTILAQTHLNDLVEDFKKLHETKEYHDTIISVGEEPSAEKISAHSVIFCTRSSCFHSVLSDKWAERKDGYFVLSKPNISALTFKLSLNFCIVEMWICKTKKVNNLGASSCYG